MDGFPVFRYTVGGLLMVLAMAGIGISCRGPSEFETLENKWRTSKQAPLVNFNEADVSRLAQIRDPRAIPILLEIINGPAFNGSPRARDEAALGLARINDVRAWRALISLLNEVPGRVSYPGMSAAFSTIGFPAVDELTKATADGRGSGQAQAFLSELKDKLEPERVRLRHDSAVADFVHSKGESPQVRAELARKILDDPAVDEAMHNDLRLALELSSSLIWRGRPEDEDLLLAALRTYGTIDLAVELLNCGDPKLVKAASVWASSHGYVVKRERTFVKIGPKWGGK